ncbi:BgTH12-05803 [Blumeria graminis f. sp. triticale]|uniref:BgtAc-30290 n=2 Tax=Blumeria graminis TaxID=34373 RepID=A0A9X9MKU3_BLUGR|nr:BgTH12-05803 [Blumeria graminis f. sp. triticale]VDB90802.1 BgtAc-30290 [Blumeria graminis f. sp. tritici]
MDLAMQFPYSYMAMSAENTPRPYPAEIIDTPDGPYIVGTGAPLRFFTSAYFDDPAIVSTQLGEMAAIFFVEEFHIDNVRHIRPPISLCDLFQGFDAVELYMHGIEFCYYIMYYIGKFAQEYQKRMNKMEEKFFWERIFHYRRMLFHVNEKINPRKRRLESSFSNIWPCSNDSRIRCTKYEHESRRHLKQNQMINESDSSLDLITNPMCRLELENPSTEKYTLGASFVKFRKFKNCRRIRDRKEKVPIITEANNPVVSSAYSRIPRPKFSTPLWSQRILSSTASKRKDSKSTYIPYVRSSDLISGNSKIPRLLCLKSQATVSGSATSRKQPTKASELYDGKKIITQATGQFKNMRKRKLSAQSQNSSPLKPDKLKKSHTSS